MGNHVNVLERLLRRSRSSQEPSINLTTELAAVRRLIEAREQTVASTCATWWNVPGADGVLVRSICESNYSKRYGDASEAQVIDTVEILYTNAVRGLMALRSSGLATEQRKLEARLGIKLSQDVDGQKLSERLAKDAIIAFEQKLGAKLPRITP